MKVQLFYSNVRVRRPMQMRLAGFMLAALLIWLALTLAGSTARAHGIGYYQIRGAAIASYFVHVWVSPGVLRTGDVHIDTAVFDASGKPALATLVQVAFVPLAGDTPAQVYLVGVPDLEYPYARGASFRLETPGQYRLEVMVSDANGASGMTSVDVEVRTIGWQVKAAIIGLGFFSAASGAWLLFQTRAFWMGGALPRKGKRSDPAIRPMEAGHFVSGGAAYTSDPELTVHQTRFVTWMKRLNGSLHAPALWIFMLVVIAHWMEHVLQIYQIYGLGWAPEIAGGILGVFYPGLIESETLHFVYDLIQWGGIVVLFPGFRGRARTAWSLAMVVQTWHFFEHVLLMGQYLSGYYLFEAPHQISILQVWFPRAELHFFYNLLGFMPMVIAVHLYIQPKLAALAALNATPSAEQSHGRDPA